MADQSGNRVEGRMYNLKEMEGLELLQRLAYMAYSLGYGECQRNQLLVDRETMVNLFWQGFEWWPELLRRLGASGVDVEGLARAIYDAGWAKECDERGALTKDEIAAEIRKHIALPAAPEEMR